MTKLEVLMYMKLALNIVALISLLTAAVILVRLRRELKRKRTRSIVVNGAFNELFKPGLHKEVFKEYEKYNARDSYERRRD